MIRMFRFLDRRPPPPEIRHKDQNIAVWSEVEKRWFIVCGTCGGNCGQCANSEAVGQASMDWLVNNLYK